MVRSFPKFHFESPKCLCIMDRAAGSSVLLQATREMHVDSDHCWLFSLIIFFINYEVNFCILEDLSVEEPETLPAGSRPTPLDEGGTERGSAWRSSIKRGRKCHYQSDKNWNLFKGNIGETSERCGLEMGFFPEHMDALLNWTELSVTLNKNWRCK